MRTSATLVTALVLLILSSTAFGKMYKWTDSKGTVHFADSPPAHSQGKVTSFSQKIITPQERERNLEIKKQDRAEEEARKKERARYFARQRQAKLYTRQLRQQQRNKETAYLRHRIALEKRQIRAGYNSAVKSCGENNHIVNDEIKCIDKKKLRYGAKMKKLNANPALYLYAKDEKAKRRGRVASFDGYQEGYGDAESVQDEYGDTGSINGGWDSDGHHYSPAGGGDLWKDDGAFMQSAAGGYINTQTGAFVPSP